MRQSSGFDKKTRLTDDHYDDNEVLEQVGFPTVRTFPPAFPGLESRALSPRVLPCMKA